MKCYLDDDTASAKLAQLLAHSGHDVQVPADVGTVGKKDAIHLTHAIRVDRVLLSKNYKDFENLHNLVLQARGHHPGILVVRQDNDPTRDMTSKGIVSAIGKLLAAGIPLTDEYVVLNHWR